MSGSPLKGRTWEDKASFWATRAEWLEQHGDPRDAAFARTNEKTCRHMAEVDG